MGGGTRVTEIIVLGADRAGWQAWRDLIDLANFSEARLWLVMRHSTFRRADREWLTRWHKLETIDGEAMLAALAQRGAPAKRAANLSAKQNTPRRAFPRVEEASFVLFRALAYCALSPEEFPTFDASWSDALMKTREWIDAQPTADEVAVSTYLRELVSECGTLDEILTRLSAAQVAFFLADCLLLVNERQLDLRSAQAPQTFAAADIAKLYEHQTQREPAIGVLAALSGADGHALAAVRMADVAADGSAAVIDGRHVRVPERARTILRAQRLWLLIDGVNDEGPFLRTSDGHRPSARKIQDRLTELSNETGMRLGPPGAPERTARRSRRREPAQTVGHPADLTRRDHRTREESG